MLSCTLYFIRHGQSLGNLSGTFLGHTDLDLSPLGYMQAKRTAEHLADIHIDKVYSSDLLRAYNTCGEYLKTCGMKPIVSQKLREIYAGDWENTQFDVLQTKFKNTYNIWINDIGNSCPDNGESVKDLTARVVGYITDISKENDGKTIAVFTHATVIRAFFNFAYGNKIENMRELRWATNASVSSVTFENGKFTVDEYGTDSFLNDLKTGFPANV